MFAVAKVTDPCLQRRRVVLLDDTAVRFNGCVAGYGSPFAGVVDKADVDGGVRLKVVGLAGLGVGVKEKIKTIALLYSVSAVQLMCSRTIK